MNFLFVITTPSKIANVETEIWSNRPNFKKNNYLYNQKWIIGDNISDLTAGHKLGLNLILVKTGLGLEMSEKLYDTGLKPYTHVCENLNDVTDLILKEFQHIT